MSSANTAATTFSCRLAVAICLVYIFCSNIGVVGSFNVHQNPCQNHSCGRCDKRIAPTSMTTTTTTTIMDVSTGTQLFLVKPKREDDDDPSLSTTTMNRVWWQTVKEKPGGLVLLPFVILFGLDLLLNIFFLTKRSIEYFVLGQAPSQETWF